MHFRTKSLVVWSKTHKELNLISHNLIFSLESSPIQITFPVGGNYDSENTLMHVFLSDVIPCGPQETGTVQLPVNHNDNLHICHTHNGPGSHKIQRSYNSTVS